MRQVIPAGKHNQVPVNGTKYNVICGSGTWNAAEALRQNVFSVAGTLEKLFVELDAAPGAGENNVFTVNKNGVGTALTITIAGATQVKDSIELAVPVTVAVGDKFSLECVASAGARIGYARYGTLFRGNVSGESCLLTLPSLFFLGTRYGTIHGQQGTLTPGVAATSIIPTPGTIKNMYVAMDVAPGVGKNYKYTLYKDSGSGFAATSLVVTITDPATTGNDTTHEVTFNAGDLAYIECLPSAAFAGGAVASIGMTFVPDTDGESLIVGASANVLSNVATEFSDLMQAPDVWGEIELEHIQTTPEDFILKKFYVGLSAAPGAGDSYTLTVRKELASPASGLEITISDAETTGNDTANEVAVSAEDVLSVQSTYSGTPGTPYAFYSMVGFIAPAAGGGSLIASKLAAGAFI